MNEVISAILNRRCVRAYTNEPVSPQDVETILKCGIQAPSARNGQPWHFTVLKSRRMMDKISDAVKRAASPAMQTPDFDCWRGGVMAIVISGRTGDGWAPGDCANAAENMFLAANALGLGCCYLASFRAPLEQDPELAREAGIPAGYTPLYALSLGHPAEEPEPKPRHTDVVTYID